MPPLGLEMRDASTLSETGFPGENLGERERRGWMAPPREVLLFAAFMTCIDVLPGCVCESPNGRGGTSAVPSTRMAIEGGVGCMMHPRPVSREHRRGGLWNVLRLRGGGGRGDKRRPSKNLVVEDEDGLEELNNFVEGRRNKIQKALKKTKRKWIGKEPVPKSVVRKWKGQDEEAKKKEAAEAFEPKFVQHEFNEFVNGFHKRKLQRRKEAALERLEKQKAKEAAQKLQRKKQKKMADLAAEEAMRRMRSLADQIPEDDPLARPSAPELPDVKHRFQHDRGVTTSVCVERMDIDGLEARHDFLASMPPLPVKEKVQAPPKKNPILVKKKRKRRGGGGRQKGKSTKVGRKGR